MADGDRQPTPEFRDELIGAADHLGIPVLAVEKDYWVSRALRGMAAAHPDGFIFKGGTSITKGWRIGNRFSEDIDILVVERPAPDSVNGREKILKAICEAALTHAEPRPSAFKEARVSTGRSASPIQPASPPTARCSTTSDSSSATPVGRRPPKYRP